jgi:TonB-linked SusC/RagA family outer membrane protein
MNAKFYPIVFLLLMTGWLYGQQTITGTVLDSATREPLIGVTVLEAQTEQGTVTDLDGRYSLNVTSADPVLIFRYTGYATKEFRLEGRTSLDISMGEEAMLFEQVVVVGYGIQRKSDLTGAVSTVKGKDINRVASANIEQALQGKVSGVYVAPASGTPGAGAVIRIRGTGTLNNANPLYVIDGMITYDASYLNPEDVESVEVLKDASAAAIYGSRGANGVIIITTKSGIPRDRALIKATTYYGVQQVARKIDLLNAREFAYAYNDFSGQNYFPDPEALGEGTDYQDEIFQDAPIRNYSLSANGGTEKISYNFSANYFDQDGIIRNSHYDRLTVRWNADYKLNSFMHIGHNLAHASAREDIAPGVITSVYRMPPVFTPRDSTGDFSDPTYFGNGIANPVADMFYKSNNHSQFTRLFGNVYAEVEFLKNFKFRSNFGVDQRNGKNRYYEPKFEVSSSQRNANDRLSAAFGERREWIWEQTLTYDKTWGDHRITALGGYTAEERKGEVLSGSRENFPGTAEELLYLSAGNDTTQMNEHEAFDEALNSNFFRVNYAFMSKYLLTLTWRTDRSSRFSKANRTGNFPSASVGWNMSDEYFVQSMPWIDRLKIRASYGVLGNQASASAYPSTGTVQSGLYAVFASSENLNYGATLTSIANANLQWETSRQTDIGLEAALFKGQLEMEVDWYNRYTYDIIAAVPIPDYVGSANDPIVNTAAVKNVGWDISANWRSGNSFIYNLGAIFSPVKNTVEKLADGRNEIFAAFIDNQPASHTVIGLPIGGFFGYKVGGVFQTQEELDNTPRFGDEELGDLRYIDANSDGVLDAKDRVYLGSPIPTLSYSFTAGFEWKGFDFNADVNGAAGHKVFNAKEVVRPDVYNWESHVVDRWTLENPSLTEPRLDREANNNRISDRYLFNGDFIRLSTISLGYTLPKTLTSKAKIDRLRVYITGNNIWSDQAYTGYSPEFPNGSNAYEVGFDFGAYPVAKSWIGGIEVNF